MASVSQDGGVEGKRPHIKTPRMQEFLRIQGDSNHKIRSCTVDGCQKTFTSLPGLRYHVRSHEVKEKPFQCLKCRKSFKSLNGLRYHRSKTRCEECTSNQSKKGQKTDKSSDLVLPEMGLRDTENLHQFAIIATGPQSPLLQTSPSGDRARHSVESDPKVTSSFPFPSSPKDVDSSNALWSHSWPTAVWQCFMRGSFIKVLSRPDCDWQTAEELADDTALSEVTTNSSTEHSIAHILIKPAAFLLRRMECNAEGKSVDLYFTADTSTGQFHILAQCPQSHPFFVKDKGWSSCSPNQTVKLYGIPSSKMEENDICLPPSHPDASFTKVYENSEVISLQLNSLDSSAVSALCSMAQQKRECQERMSPPIVQHVTIDASKYQQCSAGPQKAKRPMNAFMLFAKQFRLEYTNKFPGKDNRAISVMLGEEWKRLGLEGQAEFKKEAEKLAKERRQISPDCWKRKK